jgi:hypothetical protein
MAWQAFETIICNALRRLTQGYVPNAHTGFLETTLASFFPNFRTQQYRRPSAHLPKAVDQHTHVPHPHLVDALDHAKETHSA